MMPWYFLQVKWKTQPYESHAKSQTRAFIDTRHQNTENWIETKNIMINWFSKGNRLLFLDSHWYVPREKMFLFITQTEFNCQSTLSECRKKLTVNSPSPTTALRVLWVQTDIQETYQHRDQAKQIEKQTREQAPG